MTCGFNWKDGAFHIHECQQEQHEDDPYIPESHVCYCGDSRERVREETSYEPAPTWPLELSPDDEIPF